MVSLALLVVLAIRMALFFHYGTHTSTLVPKQVDCNMCRFSKLLLFFSCCNFLCVVLAAAYIEVSPVSLVVLAIFLAPFFIVTHTDETGLLLLL